MALPLTEEQARKRVQQLEKTLAEVPNYQKELLSLKKLLEAYDELKKVYGDNVPVEKYMVKGTISLRQAVKEIVLESQLRPITVNDIWEKAQLKGVLSQAARPQSVIESYLYKLAEKGIVKKDPNRKGTWVWTGLSNF